MFVDEVYREFLDIRTIIYHPQKTMSSEAKKTRKDIQTTKKEEEFSLFQGDTELGQKIRDVLNSGGYAIFSTLIMVYTLFADDIRQIAFPQSADLTFSILTLICMVIYTFQIVLFSFVQKDYFLKYYFWLDILSTITMTFDLVWITQFLTGGGKSAASVSQITRASRAARLGTRTVRLIKLVRMVKILKQMKALTKDLAQKTALQEPDKVSERVSQRMSSIRSRMASARHMARTSSLKAKGQMVSRRWSVIKDMNCINVAGATNSSKNVTSLNFLPYKGPDQVIMSGRGSEHPSEVNSESSESKMNSIQLAASSKNVESAKKIESFKPVRRSQEKEKPVMVLEKLDEVQQEDAESPRTKKATKLKRLKSSFETDSPSGEISESDNEIEIPPDSKVGSKVQEQVQKNVILLIILILVSIPLLDSSTWFQNKRVYDNSIKDLIYFAQNVPGQYQNQADSYIQQAMAFSNPLLYFEITTTNVQDTFPDNYNAYSGTLNGILSSTRSDDVDVYSGDTFRVAYDIFEYNKTTAILNICRTIFVCLLLIITTMVFSNDLQFAAIQPLEEMFDTVRKIAMHPLGALRQIEEKNLCMERIEQYDESQEITEPKILQNTIVKIGSLLAIGFGEAGTQIISKVIEDPSIVNVVIPGQKIMALFGFCDIRNFTDATEVLEADVMVFVNQIADICHKVTYEHIGSPNKNIGDAFLLVWKFSQEDCHTTEKGDDIKIDLIPNTKVRQQADLAVLAIVNIISECAKAQKLQKYKQIKGLQQRIANYNGVKMGFGLHVGWAIEGPIGSEYKIDASYLSKHVNMAARLEGATKQYGCHMLITGEVYNLMTHNKHYLRQVDRVLPSGDTQVRDLYTVDMSTETLFERVGVKEEVKLDEKERKVAKVKQNMERKQLWDNLNKQHMTDPMWVNDQMKVMREPYSYKFYEQWSLGFQHYLDGKWEEALAELTTASSLGPKGQDGPSLSLIKYIENHKAKAPQDWMGFREFD